jgi:hypothetical protein
MESDDQKPSIDSTMNSNVTRRDFIKYTAGTVACMSLGTFTYGCGSSSGTHSIASYPIDSTVVTTAERMLSFPYTPSDPPPNLLPATSPPPASPNGGAGLRITELSTVSEYGSKGYGAWKFGAPLPIVPRKDLMPGKDAYPTPTRKTKLLNFFVMTDIHITDKEAPNSFIYLQQLD